MNTAWTVVTPPASEPLTVEQAKEHLRLDTNDEDAGVERRTRSARTQAENFMRRGILTQTLKYTQDYFSDEIQLPRAAPLQSVTTVQYYDTTGALVTLASSVYLVDDVSRPARIRRAPNQSWPALQACRPMAVVITYKVGWTDPTLIPADIIDAICLLLGDRHEFRENTIAGSGVALTELPNGADALLMPYRVWWHAPTCEAVDSYA